MVHRRHGIFAGSLFLLVLVAACATVLPSEYGPTNGRRELPGPILALAGEGNTVVAANGEGVYLREGSGEWQKLEIPGIRDLGSITALAVRGQDICVGTDGEGLFLLSEGVWEVRAARYGGLPDDHVLTIAFDGDAEGLPGDHLYVGTEKGFGVRSMGEWTIYNPEGKWLAKLAEIAPGGTGGTFLGSNFKLGAKGEDPEFFKPPITAIAVGPDKVVFGNEDSRIAMVGPGGVATVYIVNEVRISRLLVEENVVWAGTSGGLVWAGLSDKALGEPWPTLRNSVRWRGRLFSTRDARPFLFRWHLVGFNTGDVPSIAREGDSLWVVYGKPDPRMSLDVTGSEASEVKPIADVRRFLSIDDYIARKERFAYESYGKDTGISGKVMGVVVQGDTGDVLIGTDRGLYLLRK
jgi:hypothetical protein